MGEIRRAERATKERPARESAPERDPIIALIEAHKQAEQVHGAAFDLDENNMEKELNALGEAMERLCAAQPTTIAGLLAKLKYLKPHVQEYLEGSAKTAELWDSITESVRRFCKVLEALDPTARSGARPSES